MLCNPICSRSKPDLVGSHPIRHAMTNLLEILVSLDPFLFVNTPKFGFIAAVLLSQ